MKRDAWVCEERVEVGFKFLERYLWFWGFGEEVCIVGPEPDCLSEFRRLGVELRGGQKRVTRNSILACSGVGKISGRTSRACVVV